MLINGFNVACKNISARFLKVRYESMSEIRFRTTAKGNFTHLYYIFRNLEPLGTEFKKVACSVTGTLLFIEFQGGKEWMYHRKYQKELGATVAYTKRTMETTKGIF